MCKILAFPGKVEIILPRVSISEKKYGLVGSRGRGEGGGGATIFASTCHNSRSVCHSEEWFSARDYQGKRVNLQYRPYIQGNSS